MRLRQLLTAFLLGGLVLLPPAHADTLPAGFGLYRSTSTDWTWDPVQAARPAAGSGEGHLVFVLPEAAVKGWSDKARVGIVSGYLGTQPRWWVSADRPFTAASKEPSPWASNLILGSALHSARISREGGDLRLELAFDSLPWLRSAWDLYFLIDVDGSEKTGFLGGDFLIQDVSLGGGDKPASLTLLWPTMRPEIGTVGEPTEFSVQIQNTTGQDMTGVTARMEVPAGVSVAGEAVLGPVELRQLETKRVSWKLAAAKPGVYHLRVSATAGENRVAARPWISFVTTRDPRHEFETMDGGFFPFPLRTTLQAGNSTGIEDFQSLTSGELKHNLFGITAQLPRTTNNEDPFIAAHAIDGDPATCWGSRWWRIAVPREPEWLEIDLGETLTAGEVRFLPAWRNSGFPAALTVQLSLNGKQWDTVLDEMDYRLTSAPDGDPLRWKDLTWQRVTFAPRELRHVRMAASRLNQGSTSFFCAPFDPFQFRVAEVAMFDADGRQLKPGHPSAKASTVHTAWYNTPETIQKTWPFMFKSGVKLNRISQWGDKTDWATVEKTKGVYVIDPEVDRAIDESVKGGIDILLTLDYGNNLYQKMANPGDFGPTWHLSHPFLQCAPTTPEAVQAWARFCAFMAGHFRGRVKYFEIWNEENGWFFDAWGNNDSVAMAKAYGQALLAAAKAIKEVNPEAIIVFGGLAGMSLDYPRIALDEGAGPLIDVFAWHPYGHATPDTAVDNFITEVNGRLIGKPRPAHIKDYEGEVAALREVLHKYNPKMQVWADEMNWFAPGEPAMPELGEWHDFGEFSQAKYLSRFFSLNAALDCAAIWWSLYNANGVQEWALLRSRDSSPRAAYYAAGYVSTVLDDAKPATDLRPEVISGDTDHLTVKAYRNATGTVTVGLWRAVAADDASVPAAVTLQLPAGLGNIATLVDSVYGYRQKAVVRMEGDHMIIPDLLVGDWPLFVQLH